MKPQFIVHKSHQQRTAKTRKKDRVIQSWSKPYLTPTWKDYLLSKAALIWLLTVGTIITILNLLY